MVEIKPAYDEVALIEAFAHRKPGESALSLLARWERFPRECFAGRSLRQLEALRTFVELSYPAEELI